MKRRQVRPLDTSPEAERIQLEIFRKMTPDERLQRGSELSQLSRGLLADGVRYRHPDYNEDEVRLAVIRIELGDELFLKVYPDAKHVLP